MKIEAIEATCHGGMRESTYAHARHDRNPLLDAGMNAAPRAEAARSEPTHTDECDAGC